LPKSLKAALVLIILISILIMVNVQADSETVDGVVYEYEIINIEAKIIRAENTIQNLIIPDKLGGYPVTAIDENAFLWDKTIEKVTISDNVKVIKEQAFLGCPKLKTVIMGNGVQELKRHCFYDCTALAEVKLSTALKIIGENVFNNCRSLQSIDLPNGLEAISGWAFTWSGLKEVSISESVKTIGTDAFSYCFSLKTVTLKNGVEEIGERAFANCPELSSIVIPDSVKELGVKAFCYDNALETITIGKNINEIGARTFAECFALKKMVISNGVRHLDGFEDDPNLREIYIPESVKEISFVCGIHYTTVEPYSMIVYGKAGSYAEKWAKEMGYFFVAGTGGNSTNKAQASAVKAVVDKTITVDSNHFPDAVFCKYVSSFDKNRDGILSAIEISAVSKIVVPAMGISSLQGLQYFNKITYLDCHLNNVSDLDVSANTELRMLWCSYNYIQKLNVGTNTKLTALWCGRNQLTDLDVSRNTTLTSLSCPYNNLIKLDVTKLPTLTELSCSGNQLSELNISKNLQLNNLDCYDNQLSILDIRSNTKLEKLYCGYNFFKTVDTSKNIYLRDFNIAHCHETLTSIDISNNPKLEMLHVSDNYRLQYVDAGKQPELNNFFCSALYDNKYFNLSKNAPLTFMTSLGQEDNVKYVDSNPSLTASVLSGNGLKLDFRECTRDGKEYYYYNNTVYAKTGSKINMSMDLMTVSLSSDISAYSFNIHCYRKGDITATLQIQNARIEASDGNVYYLKEMNGIKKIYAKQNTWDTDVYAFASLQFDLKTALSPNVWHGGVFKADVTVVRID